MHKLHRRCVTECKRSSDSTELGDERMLRSHAINEMLNVVSIVLLFFFSFFALLLIFLIEILLMISDISVFACAYHIEQGNNCKRCRI